MERNFKEAVLNRRTYYSIDNKISVPDEEIKEIINFAVKHIPSAFNSQSTRIVLLLGDHHKRLWDLVKDNLRKFVKAEDFGDTEAKIDGSFAAGYGTILFFEDEAVVEGLQKAFPSYSEKFPVWSHHTSAMHQYAVWTMLEDAGLGASLQHYNPLIDMEVAKKWNLDLKWTLVAQMPFGNPTAQPGNKEFNSLEGRIKFFE